MRLYGENEVGALLRRAAELQASQGESATSGLTIDELKTIAAEAGIDPKFVEQAAMGTGRVERRGERFYFWGGPVKLDDERAVAGEVRADLWPDVVRAANDVFGDGEASSLGRGLEWKRMPMGYSQPHARVSVVPRAGKTTIRVQRRLDNEAASVHMISFSLVFLFGILFPILSGLSLWLTIPVVLAVLALTFFASRLGFKAVSRAQQEKFDALVGQIEALATQDIAAQTGETTADAARADAVLERTPIAARLALPDDEPLADAAEPVRPRGRDRA